MLIENFPVWMNDRQAGTVQIRRAGLYLEVGCQCALPDDRIYRLYAENKDGVQALGIFIPEKDSYIVRTKLPARRLELQHVRFYIIPAHEHVQPQIIRICDEMPFQHLDRLEEMYCVVNGGELFLAINGDHSD